MARTNKLILLGIIAVLAIIIGIYIQHSAVHTLPPKKTVAHVQPAQPQLGRQAHQAIVTGKPKPADSLTQHPLKKSEQLVQPTDLAQQPKPADTFAEPVLKTLPQILPPPILPESAVAVVVPKEPVPPAHKDTLPAIIPPIVVRDTIPPHVHAEPAGGLFDAGVRVKLRADKQCTIEWKTQQDTGWNKYTAQGNCCRFNNYHYHPSF